MLSKLCEHDLQGWDDHLPYLMCAYRSTVQDSTGCSPNAMVYGREITLPVDLMYTTLPNQDYSCPVEYVEWVRENLHKAALRQKTYYDQRAQTRHYNLGDWVLRLYPPLAQDKLNYQYVGPYLIVKILGPVNYLIQKTPQA